MASASIIALGLNSKSFTSLYTKGYVVTYCKYVFSGKLEKEVN